MLVYKLIDDKRTLKITEKLIQTASSYSIHLFAENTVYSHKGIPVTATER